MKSNKHIEIVRSSINGLTSMGNKSCAMIVDVLQKHYTQVGVTTVNNLTDLNDLVAKEPDLSFLGMKNIPISATPTTLPTKVWLSAHLESRGLQYTGSTGLAIALDFDKPTAKRVVKKAGLKTSSYFMAKPGQFTNSQQLPLPYPLFVKPPAAGGGKGIGADSVVRDFAGFTAKVAMIARDFGCDALAETYLSGREFSVGILAMPYSDELTVMPIELITEKNAQGDSILGANIKADDTERIIAVSDPTIKTLVGDLGLAVFKALGARDYGRIDIRLDDQGVPHFLEANLIPGLADHVFVSYFTRACQLNENMDYETMILRIVELGLARTESLPVAPLREVLGPKLNPILAQ